MPESNASNLEIDYSPVSSFQLVQNKPLTNLGSTCHQVSPAIRERIVKLFGSSATVNLPTPRTLPTRSNVAPVNQGSNGAATLSAHNSNGALSSNFNPNKQEVSLGSAANLQLKTPDPKFGKRFQPLNSLNHLKLSKSSLRAEDESNGVYKMNENRIQKYHVSVDGRIIYTQSGFPLDTKAEYQRKSTHANQKQATTPGYEFVPAHVRVFTNDSPQQVLPFPSDDWHQSLLWVLVQTGECTLVFTGMVKANRFHHSSFTHGEGVTGAGEWIVEGGKLKKISSMSGHYMPDMASFRESLKLMGNAILPETLMLVYDTVSQKMVEVSYQALSADWTRYKTHPASYTLGDPTNLLRDKDILY